MGNFKPYSDFLTEHGVWAAYRGKLRSGVSVFSLVVEIRNTTGQIGYSFSSTIGPESMTFFRYQNRIVEAQFGDCSLFYPFFIEYVINEGCRGHSSFVDVPIEVNYTTDHLYRRAATTT